MNLLQFLEAVDARITGGTEYQWKCYPSARYLDISDIDGVDVGACVFSTVSQEVYEVEFYVSDDDVAYRWSDPVWVGARQVTAAGKGIDDSIAYDGVKYTEIESEEEMLKLIRSIVHMTYVHSHHEVEGAV